MRLNRIQELVARHGDYLALDPRAVLPAGAQERSKAEAEAKTLEAAAPRASRQIAVVSLHGEMVPDAIYRDEIGTRALTERMQQLAGDERTAAIVLDIDSPGGMVVGTPELGAAVAAAARHKPVVASVNHLAASAAYWVASQAGEIVVSPSGEVGSIGVWSAHINASEAWKKFGLEWTLISAGEYKVEGHPFGPLDDVARAEMQRGVDYHYANFLAAVAAGRGVSAATVEKNYGRGRVLEAPRALAAGMVDGIETLDETLARVAALVRDRQASAAQVAARAVRLRQARLQAAKNRA